MNSAQNHLFIFMPCTNGRRLSVLVVRISAFSDFEATYAKQGYRYRVGCSYVQYLSVSFARVPSLNLFAHIYLFYPRPIFDFICPY